MADFVEGEDMTLKKNHPAGYNGITDGVIWQQLLLFFFPILFGTFFQQLYNTADAMIVGKFVGKEALSAVGGTTGTLINLLVGFLSYPSSMGQRKTSRCRNRSTQRSVWRWPAVWHS